MILNLVKSFKLEFAFLRVNSRIQFELRQRVEFASADSAFVDCPCQRLWSRPRRVLKSRFFKAGRKTVRQHDLNWRAGNDDRERTRRKKIAGPMRGLNENETF